MLSTSARLLRLAALLQARRHWPGPALAERLEVDARTLRRDVDRLRTLGYPVQASSGRGGGYSLGSGANLPPLMLDDSEAVTLAVALRAATAAVAGIEDAAQELLAKLDQWLPTRLRRRATALHNVTLSLGSPEALADAGILASIATACRDTCRLRFGYRKHDGEHSDRHVEPARLINYGRRWYLVGWDTDRSDWRTYRADRIQSPVHSGNQFAPRDPGFDFLEHVRKAISWSPFEHRVTVRLQGPADQLVETVPAWCGVLIPETDESALLQVGADSPDALLATLLMLGHPFEMVEGDPAGLASLQAAHARVGEALGGLVRTVSSSHWAEDGHPCRPPV